MGVGVAHDVIELCLVYKIHNNIGPIMIDMIIA